jgi:ribosomal protein L11 methyltransferase
VIRLALRVKRRDAELALADLLDLAPSGVEEHDDGGETVEYAVYGAPGELPALPALQAAIGGALVEVRSSEVPDDWQQRWRHFHRPVELPAPAGGPVRALRVRPPWEQGSAEVGVLEIVIDPGQAFGTGSHATTRLCLELLLELAASGAGGGILDVGTGSGVLAIAAAKLGFGPVLALDHDPLSVEAARENAIVNGAQIEVARHDLRVDVLPPLGGEIVLANLLRPLLVELAEAMTGPPAQLIASGLLAAEAEEVVQAFAGRHQMRLRERRAAGDWAAVWLVSASAPAAAGAGA